MNALNSQKVIIGCEEWCAFPSLQLPAVKARVDSGAKTSSLHALHIAFFTKSDEQWVRFEVHPLQNNHKVTLQCEAKLVDQRVIKSSNGEKENRPVISLPLRAGEHTWDVQVTLTNRDSMGYRMLLGREAMSGRVLIDPEGSFLLGDHSRDDLITLYPAKQKR